MDSSDKTDKIMLEGLFTTVTNVNFNDETIQELIDKVNNLKLEITKNNNTTPCPNYDLTTLWHANEDIRSLKSLILFKNSIRIIHELLFFVNHFLL